MNQPIGVIDSGVGGLTVLHELKRQLPKERFVYLGDTLRCPYGSKEKEEVEQFTWDIVHYLLKFDIKMLVIACNTATAIVLEQLKQTLPIPVIGVIAPGARAAIKATQTNHVAIIGTQNTIDSQAYEKELLSIKPDLETYGVACPKFVPLIEGGTFDRYDAYHIVEDSLIELKEFPTIDTLILGCTHYPIIQSIIEEVVGGQITVLSSALETGFEVSSVLTYHSMQATDDNIDRQDPIILTTGSLHTFHQIKEELFQFKSAQMAHITLT
ncbi:glutamate racemase [Halalkalibacillus sediminis]|uniref:Glutamate racemase n=1 Tax=Halalkalibacillus sediminis TaxID=2018042 RepID=A0A2I0QYM1_9BACI|nr:glutamate racemase [Halalkalibacillus sediminis]PKR79220.1 glutamate racemase [Halalkalibacillus sediminis]